MALAAGAGPAPQEGLGARPAAPVCAQQGSFHLPPQAVGGGPGGSRNNPQLQSGGAEGPLRVLLPSGAGQGLAQVPLLPDSASPRLWLQPGVPQGTRVPHLPHQSVPISKKGMPRSWSQALLGSAQQWDKRQEEKLLTRKFHLDMRKFLPARRLSRGTDCPEVEWGLPH